MSNGTGQAASYDVRYAAGTISWGSATDVTRGSCATPLAGTTVGARRTCTVLALSPSTAYGVQLIAFRGLQGLGAGVIMGMAFVIIADLFAPAERAKSGR